MVNWLCQLTDWEIGTKASLSRVYNQQHTKHTDDPLIANLFKLLQRRRKKTHEIVCNKKLDFVKKQIHFSFLFFLLSTTSPDCTFSPLYAVYPCFFRQKLLYDKRIRDKVSDNEIKQIWIGRRRSFGVRAENRFSIKQVLIGILLLRPPHDRHGNNFSSLGLDMKNAAHVKIHFFTVHERRRKRRNDEWTESFSVINCTKVKSTFFQQIARTRCGKFLWRNIAIPLSAFHFIPS